MKKVVIYLIQLYRKYISPMSAPKCKYTPTCSEYAIEAVEKHGVFKGGFMAFYRILRCNPFSKGGYDPVK
jgi:putative membrane protein insertion efficiency factor